MSSDFVILLRRAAGLLLLAALLSVQAAPSAQAGADSITQPPVFAPPAYVPPADPPKTELVIPPVFRPYLGPNNQWEMGPPLTIDRQGGQGSSASGRRVVLVPDYDDQLTRRSSAAVVLLLQQTSRFCKALPEEYMVDCMAERLSEIARTLPDTPDYAEVKQALTEAADRIEAIVQANRDPAAPRIQARSEGEQPVSTSRPLTAVKPEAVAAVKEQAAAVLEETETILLRSAEQSQERAAQFVEIAQAVGSNKVLLRS